MTRILITGGSGFLGRRLGKRLREAGYEVVLASRNNKQNLMASRFSGCEAIAMDVSRLESVRDAVHRFRPEVIFHAAATKFVDASEREPLEAVDVNVVGSQNVARVAIDRGVGLVVGISTDKAAPPVRNTYGLTKALMERVFCSLDGQSDTRFLCVRYGNVAWSTGSVLPIWRRMLRERGVIGTTGPEMVRFFFTVEEAVQLVLTAFQAVDELHGKVLARRMKSARMRDILDVWVEEAGARYERIEGRPGERDEEFLIGELELPYTRQVEYDGIPHYVISFNEEIAEPLPAPLSSGNAERLTRAEMKALIDNPPEEEA